MKEKLCSLVRTALLALFVTAALVLNTTAIAQAPPGSLWYNGDWDYVNGYLNQQRVDLVQAAVYDDFDVTAPLGWDVTAVFSDNVLFVLNPNDIKGAFWEIRTGVSEGNAGVLTARGSTQSPVVTFTGRESGILFEYMVEVTGLNIFLPMLSSGQHYWLNVTPIFRVGYSYNTTTSGTHAVGSPPGNDQSAFFTSTYLGAYFEGQPYDFSMGVIGTVVPEPATVALLTCGVGALLIALRRRRAA